jgi:hypothetical protein
MYDVDRECSMHEESEKSWYGHCTPREHLEERGVDGRIILRYILWNLYVKMRTGFN